MNTKKCFWGETGKIGNLLQVEIETNQKKEVIISSLYAVIQDDLF
jgi:hypothetical protein